MDANQLDYLVTSSLSAYLDANPSPQSVAVLTKVIQNASTKTEVKYRRIRLSNPKIKQNLLDTFGALDVLALAGFEQREEDAESILYFVEPTSEGYSSQMIARILTQLAPLVEAKSKTTMASKSNDSSPDLFLSQEERKKRTERMLAIKRERRKEREAVKRRIAEDKQERIARQKHGNFRLNYDDEPVAMGIDIRKLRKDLPETKSPSPAGILPEAVNDYKKKDPPPNTIADDSSILLATHSATPQNNQDRKSPDEAGIKQKPLAPMKNTVSLEEMEELFGSLAASAPASGIRDTSIYRDKKDPSTGSCLKRLFRELGQMELPVNPSIWLKYDEETPQFIRFVIAAPGNTPYAHGLFAFDMKIPNDYPNSPPSVTLLTTGEGSVRFGPNLYDNGKVCLSLLGTWNGPKWSPKSSSIQQILVSIQGLILGVDHPFYLEPGYGGWEGDVKDGQFTLKGHTLRGETVSSEVGLPAEVVEYEDKVRLGTLKYAMEDMINVPHYLESFREQIHVHFYCNHGNLVQEVCGWQSLSCFGYSRSETYAQQMKKCIDRIKVSLSQLPRPSASSCDMKLAAIDFEASSIDKTSTSPNKMLPESMTDCETKKDVSADGIVALRDELHLAAANGDYVSTGKLKEKIEIIDVIYQKMTLAAAEGNFIRAGRLQEQYTALLPAKASTGSKESEDPSGGAVVLEERGLGESDNGSDVDMDDLGESSIERNLLFPPSFGGLKVGKDVFVPGNLCVSRSNPSHSWGTGATLMPHCSNVGYVHGDCGLETTTVARKVPPQGYGCRIRFRLPDGSTITETFHKEEKLSSLYDSLKDRIGTDDSETSRLHAIAPLVTGGAFAQPESSTGYTLLLSHPKREFNYEMHGTKSLDELGLSPSATLTVMKCSYRGIVHRGELESRLAEAQDGAMDLDGLTYEGLLELTERVGGATPSAGMPFVGLSRQDLEANSTLFSASTYLQSLKESTQGNSRCPVCLGDFDSDERTPVLRQLHLCRHTFHTACLETWLRTRSSCPICKTSVVEAEK